MEIMSGKETRVREKREKIMEFLSEFTVLDFNRERAVLAGEVLCEREQIKPNKAKISLASSGTKQGRAN